MPMALLAISANGGGFGRTSGKPLSLLRSRGALAVLALAANGELVADKLSFIPSRTDPAALFGRLLFGGISGSLVAREAGRSIPSGALLGAAGAAAGSYAGYYARKSLVKATGFPDFVWAVTEDVVALGLGLFTIRQYERK